MCVPQWSVDAIAELTSGLGEMCGCVGQGRQSLGDRLPYWDGGKRGGCPSLGFVGANEQIMVCVWIQMWILDQVCCIPVVLGYTHFIPPFPLPLPLPPSFPLSPSVKSLLKSLKQFQNITHQLLTLSLTL